jgi:hypothetical protein
MASTPPTHVGATQLVHALALQLAISPSSKSSPARVHATNHVRAPPASTRLPTQSNQSFVRLPACEFERRIGSESCVHAAEFSLESAAKARHRGGHRPHGVSRYRSLAQRVCVAPEP